MKSDHGEIEVYLCPDVTTAKPKLQTPIPPSDPLLADVLSEKSPFTPQAILNSTTIRPMPSTSARKNLTFQNSPDSKLNENKDPLFNNFNMGAGSISKGDNFVSFSQPSCSSSQFTDIAGLDPLHLSPLNDSLRRIFDEPSTNRSEENIRLKHALISESDDFGPIGNRYPLTMHDLGTTGKKKICCLYLFLFYFIINQTKSFIVHIDLNYKYIL